MLLVEEGAGTSEFGFCAQNGVETAYSDIHILPKKSCFSGGRGCGISPADGHSAF